jgi:hypothetical protein
MGAQTTTATAQTIVEERAQALPYRAQRPGRRCNLDHLEPGLTEEVLQAVLGVAVEVVGFFVQSPGLRRRQQQHPSWPHHSLHLAEKIARLRYMLQHLRADHGVECAGAEGQAFAEAGDVGLIAGSERALRFRADVLRRAGEETPVRLRAAADVENPATNPVAVAREASLERGLDDVERIEPRALDSGHEGGGQRLLHPAQDCARRNK